MASYHLCRIGWVDVATAAPILQRPRVATESAIGRLSEARIGGVSLIRSVEGTPPDSPPAYKLGDRARSKLAGHVKHLEAPRARTNLILVWARERRRASTTEIADLTGLSVPYVGKLLTELELEGRLVAGRPNKRGRGFFYTPTSD